MEASALVCLSSESPCEKFTSMMERPHEEDTQSCDKDNLCEPCLQSLGLNLGCFWVNSSLFLSDWPRHQRNIIKGPHTTKVLKRRIIQLSSVESLSNQMAAYGNLALNSTPVSLHPKHRGRSVRRGRKNARTRRGGLWSCVLNIDMAIPLTKSESCDFLLRQDRSYHHLIMAGEEELEALTLLKDSLAVNDGGGTFFTRVATG